MIDLATKLRGKVVAITGASGYIGSALTEQLGRYPVKVIRISRQEITPKLDIEDWKLDLNISESWRRIISHADIIFHLAGNTSVYAAENDPEENLKSTLCPIFHLIHASKKSKCLPRIVFASTATVYGLTNALPVPETRKPYPITIYDLHKLFAEQQLDMANRNNLASSISLRLANVYGPSPDEARAGDRGIISKVTQTSLEGGNIKIYGHGNYLRDYVYIDDVVEAFLCAGVIENTTKNVINVASGVGYTVKEAFGLILLEVERVTGILVDVEKTRWPNDVNDIEKRDFVASIKRINSLFRWSPKVSLEEGIHRLVMHHSR